MAGAKTRIGSPPTDTRRLRMRGKDVLTEVVGKLTFAETFFLISIGRLPTSTERTVLDAALVMLMDHGLTQNAVVARLVEESVPDDIQVPIAAGLLMVGNKFIGTMAGAGKLLAEGHAHVGDKAQWADEVVRRAKSGAVASDIYNNKIVAERSYMQTANTRVVTFEMCGNDGLQARSKRPRPVGGFPVCISPRTVSVVVHEKIAAAGGEVFEEIK